MKVGFELVEHDHGGTLDAIASLAHLAGGHALAVRCVAPAAVLRNILGIVPPQATG